MSLLVSLFEKICYQDMAYTIPYMVLIAFSRAAGSVGQQGLLPRHADPKLWVMETRGGEEREAVVKLMQKAVNMAAAGTPLAITSVFAQDHLRVRSHKDLTPSSVCDTQDGDCACPAQSADLSTLLSCAG